MITLIRSVAWAGLFLALFAGPGLCAETKTATPVAPPPDIQNFELQGSRIIGCCCAHPCPCRLNMKPMQSHGCDHTDAIHIDKGFIGDVDMSGVSYVVIGRGFGSDVEGNWAYVYLGDKATEPQAKALEAMMNAQVAGWGLKAAHLAGKFLGMRRVPMTYTVSSDKNVYEVTIPEILEFKTKAHYNPGQKAPVMSTGIMDAFGDKFVHADCLVHKYNDPQIKYSWDLTGRQSNQAEFVLTDEKVAAGGVGWGCWTAHSDYNDKSKYQEEMIEKDHQ
jgi:hypothetical protein